MSAVAPASGTCQHVARDRTSILWLLTKGFGQKMKSMAKESDHLAAILRCLTLEFEVRGQRLTPDQRNPGRQHGPSVVARPRLRARAGHTLII